VLEKWMLPTVSQQSEEAFDEISRAAWLLVKGGLLRGKGHYGDAVDIFYAVRIIYLRELGIDSPEAWNDVASTKLEEGTALEEAMTMFEDVLKFKLLIECFDRRCKLLGEEHQATQNTMTEISIEFANQSKLKESLEWTLRCSSIQKRGGGDDHPQTSRMQNNLGILYLMLGDFASALPHIQAASNVYQRTLGPDHMLTLVILANLGNTYRLLGQYVEAERILLDCLQRIQTDDLAKAA
ncbi:unnamed protein product, partial [Aphanomyces euteiches]